MLHEPIKKRNV